MEELVQALVFATVPRDGKDMIVIHVSTYHMYMLKFNLLLIYN